METKIVYGYDPEIGRFTGHAVAFESPLEPGVFLLPAYSTEVAPDLSEPLPEGKCWAWGGEAWVKIDIPVITEAE